MMKNENDDTLDTSYFIDVTDLSTVKMIQAAYELSKPVGMGFMHYTSNPLTVEEAQEHIRPNGFVNLDYVLGRCCKFRIIVNNGKKYTPKSWYDHTEEDLKNLIEMAKSE